MSFERYRKLAVMMAIALFVTRPAHAGLIGDNINLNQLFPNTSTVFQNDGSATVAAFFPFTDGGVVNVGVGDSTIKFTFNAGAMLFGGPSTFIPAAFNGYSITDLSGRRFGGATIDPTTNMAGFSSSDISVDLNSIFVNFSGLTASGTTVVQLDLLFQSVPEPPTLVLFFGAVAFLAWRGTRLKAGGADGKRVAV